MTGKRQRKIDGRDVLPEQPFFWRMDAQKLDFEDNTFDVVISRNLTWNLEHPDVAYREWVRVLKAGGRLLNFDANWYGYLYEEEQRKAYENAGKMWKTTAWMITISVQILSAWNGLPSRYRCQRSAVPVGT